MIDFILVALLQAVAGDPAGPPETANSPAPPAAEQSTAQMPRQEGEQVRCRREIITGTRVTRRVCTTPEQDRAMSDESRAFVDQAQRQMPAQSN